MVINNENKRNISMYKQANPTPNVDSNDANNPLPAALMLGAIGGVAGLGGSLLSKKQRKHKLRNTLLGATALPAAFLAANKWGPEAVKGKLNEFSGDVYDQYANHIQGKLPESMAKYIDSRSANKDSDVIAARQEQSEADTALTNAEEKRNTSKKDLEAAESSLRGTKSQLADAESTKSRAQSDYATHKNNPFQPSPLTPRPTYDGMSKEDYDWRAREDYDARANELENEKKNTKEIELARGAYQSALNTIGKEETATKQKYDQAVEGNTAQITKNTENKTNLETELSGKQKAYAQLDTQEQQALDRIKTVMEQAAGNLDSPESTDAWKDISKQIETLTQGQREAVIKRLKQEGNAGKLSPVAQKQYNIIKNVLANLDNQRVGAVNNLEMAKQQHQANKDALAQAQQDLKDRQKADAGVLSGMKGDLDTLKQELDESKRRQYTKADRKDPGYQNALSLHKDEDAQIQALEELVNLAESNKPGTTDAVAQRLIKADDAEAKKLYDEAVKQRKRYNEEYSPLKRNQAMVNARNKREAVIKAEEEQKVIDERNTWMAKNPGKIPPKDLMDEGLITQRVLKATDERMRVEGPKFEAWAGEQFDQAASKDSMYQKGKAERALHDYVNKVVGGKKEQLIELRNQLDTKMREEQAELAKNVKLLQDQYDMISKTYNDSKSRDTTSELEAAVAAKEKALEASIANITKYEEAIKNIDAGIDQIYNYDALKPALQQFSDDYTAENITPLEQQLQALKDAYNEQVAELRGRTASDQFAVQNTYANKRYGASEEIGNLSNRVQELSDKITELKKDRDKLDADNRETMGGFTKRRGDAQRAFESADNAEKARLGNIATQLAKLKTDYEQGRAARNKAEADWSRKHQEEERINNEGQQRWDETLADLEDTLERAQSGYNTARSNEAEARHAAEEFKSQYEADDEAYNNANSAYESAVENNEDTTAKVKNRQKKRQNQALAATGGGAGLIVLLSALNKLRKRRKQKISPEEYLNYLEEEGMA